MLLSRRKTLTSPGRVDEIRRDFCTGFITSKRGKAEGAALLSLERRRPRGDLINVQVSEGRMSQGWGRTLLSIAQQSDERQQAQTRTQEAPSEHNKMFLSCKDD